MTNITTRFFHLLITTTAFWFMFNSGCYAVEISAKYKNRAVSYAEPGERDTYLSLKSKGMRKVGTEEIITDWSLHCLYTDGAPTMGVSVYAKCTPTTVTRFGDMTNMFPTTDLSVGQIACNKGEGISVIVVDPATQDYEYVADLTRHRDTNKVVNSTNIGIRHGAGVYDAIAGEATHEEATFCKSGSCEIM